MPYFIYRVNDVPIRQLKKLEQHDAYRDASASAKRLRTEHVDMIKMIHAETELDAEDLLNQVRDPLLELGDE